MIVAVLLHVGATLKHKARVADYMWRARHIARANGIPGRLWARRALVHDLSKLGPAEALAFAEVTPLLKAARYDSPAYHEGRRRLGGALEHHYRANTHHPEHHAPGKAGRGALQYMGLADRLEMLCDWAAAVERSPDGDVFESIAKNADRFGYGPEISRELVGWAYDGLALRPRSPQAAAAFDEARVQAQEGGDGDAVGR